jgi:hypothetical protein
MWHAWVRREMNRGFCWRNLMERGCLEYLGTEWRMLNKQDGMADMHSINLAEDRDKRWAILDMVINPQPAKK